MQLSCEIARDMLWLLVSQASGQNKPHGLEGYSSVEIYCTSIPCTYTPTSSSECIHLVIAIPIGLFD